MRLSAACSAAARAEPTAGGTRELGVTRVTHRVTTRAGAAGTASAREILARSDSDWVANGGTPIAPRDAVRDDDSKILIAGGYGAAGSEVSRVLASAFPDRVRIAGRNAGAARGLCDRIGWGAEPRTLDVGNPATFEAALSGVGTVVCCIDQPERLLLRAAIERGLAYTDIAPHLVSLDGLAVLHASAIASGARVVLGAGLSPGISSVLARAGSDRVAPVEAVESCVLLGIGDVFGPASLAFILDEVRRPFTLRVRGRNRKAWAFRGSRRVRFPAPFEVRRAYLFPFSDAAGYPRTLGAATSRAWLALEPRWLGGVVRWMLAAGGRRLLSRARFAGESRSALERLKRGRPDCDRFALSVQVVGARGRAVLSVWGRNQSHATGIGAAEIARSLVEQEVDCAGVWCAEQVLAPGPFFERLRAHGLHVAQSLEAPAQSSGR